MRSSSLWTAFSLLSLLPACSTSSPSDQPLEHGDADWQRPPFDPPGGDGSNPGPGGGGEGGGSSDPGGDGGATSGDWGTSGTTGDPPTMCEPTMVGGSDSGTTTGGMSCDRQSGACEPAGAQDTAAIPCCDDPDCGCATGYCDLTPCGADGYCDCQCTADPDCGADSCMPGSSTGSSGTDTDSSSSTTGAEAPEATPSKLAQQLAPQLACPDTTAPVVLYMSNDDSNSQASPILARRTIMEGQIVDPFRIRIHEFLNYYDLSFDNPEGKPAQVGLQMRRIDAAAGEFVLMAHAQGQKIDPQERRPVNLVFSLDTSGSMSGEPLDYLKASMRAIAGSLKAGDVASIVTWDSTQNVVLQSHEVSGRDDDTLIEHIERLEAGGSTDLHAGLVTAYDLARADFSPDRINRVVLISDGGANTGVTDLQIISDAAEDTDGEGIYMVGVGVGSSGYYSDELMDAVTDAGKGSYLFIDRAEEAERMFGERFLSTMEVAARNVRLELTLPWYFGIKEFHGEEYSEDPEEVDPQHLAPNDAMAYHQIIASCDPGAVQADDEIKAKVTYEDPITHEPGEDELELAIGKLVENDAEQLYKADVVVAYAQSLIVIGDLANAGQREAALEVARDMVDWLGSAAETLEDTEVVEMKELMQSYVGVLENG